jgi:Xaa-Pro aminopeptidase
MQIAPAENLGARVARVRRALEARQLDAFVVTSLPNIAYLTGFFASAAALVMTPERLIGIGDGRYASVLRARADAFPTLSPVILEPGASYDEAIVTTLAPLAGLRVGFEAAHTSVQRYRSITGRLAQHQGWSNGLAETDGIVEDHRLTKDAWEVGRLRDGAARLSDVAKYILPKVLAGKTESLVAAEIEGELRRVGFERPAFDTIVAAGANAALPHARASDRTIESGELVVIDFGGTLDGYCTDLTRTIVAAEPHARSTGSAAAHGRRLIEQVSEAQHAAFAVLKPGAQPEAADRAARECLAQYQLADAFTHGTGHGLGLEIHEGPRVTRARADRAEPRLAPGMVMTLEPGVYFPGWGGVRIEDDVLVTEDGAEWLTDVPREW